MFKIKKKNNDEKKSISIEVEAEQLNLRGVYSNLAIISYTNREFLIDFCLKAYEKQHLVSRIITSPGHAKALANVLKNKIEEYESRFGIIEPEKQRIKMKFKKLKKTKNE